MIGAATMALFCGGWERLLRNLLPAARPPPRGYLQHRAELARGGGRAAAAAKKRE